MELLLDLFDRRVSGDVIEAGCFTGGTSVLLRAMLDVEVRVTEEAGGVPARPQPRRLFLADSFEGIPLPRTKRGKRIDTTSSWPTRYEATESQVHSTLRRYGYFDDERVALVPGFFNVSLPAAPIRQLALVHIDADAYESVKDALEALYPKLVPGGHVVIDDFHLPGVRAAVHEYRAAHRVSESLLPVPTDYVTTCAPDWAAQRTYAKLFNIQPLMAAYWTKAPALQRVPWRS